MTPLELRIIDGSEDNRLLEHIAQLERLPNLSSAEERTLERCYHRLDQLTDPERDPISGSHNVLAHLLASHILGRPM